MAKPGDTLASIEFVAETKTCSVCAGPVKIQKSKSRTVVTYQEGAFHAKEVRKQCAQDSSHPILGSEVLAHLVKPQACFGYDLIVQVGLARYVRGKQRNEIRAELYRKCGYSPSEGSMFESVRPFLALS